MAAQRRRVRIDVSDGFSISIKVDRLLFGSHLISPRRIDSMAILATRLKSGSD
jgi:hypothetical protein